MDKLLKVLGAKSKDTSGAVAKAPIHKCLVQDGIFTTGNGQVIISRRLEDRRIAAGVFFVDVWCVGVKAAFYAVMSSRRFRDIATPALRDVDAAYARKVIEGAVGYATSLGLEQPADYPIASKVLGDIDASVCRERFDFGKDGRPCFVKWPTCPADRARIIMETLTKTCGLGGFEVTT